MSTFYNTKYLQICVIAIILVLAGVDLYFRCINYIPVWDDLAYEYPLGEHYISSPDNDYSKKLDSLSDVFTSQINHYNYTNGRSIVHTILQMFALYGTYKWYHLFAPLLLIVTLVLFVCYATPGLRKKPLIWLLASFTWLYLFPPTGPYYRPMFGLNYLYPMALVLGYLLIWRYLREIIDKKQSILYIIGLPIYGFIVGWSHESFSIPLSGITFFYCIANYKKIGVSQKLLFFSLWIGTFILFIAPGNFCRVSGMGVSFITNIGIGILMFLSIKIFWLLLLLVIVMVIFGKYSIRQLIKAEGWDLGLWALTVVFGLIAHSGSWSYNGIEFISAILIFKLINLWSKKVKLQSNCQLGLTVGLFFIMAVHQVTIIKAHSCIYQSQLRMIDDYRNSMDGIVKWSEPLLSPVVVPFVDRWDRSASTIWWTLKLEYGRDKDVPFIALNERDWEVLKNPETFFIPENKVPGDSPFYEGDQYYWALADEVPANKRYSVNLKPVKLEECPYLLIKLKKIFTPNSFWTTDFIMSDSMKSVSKLHPDIKMIPKTSWRYVESITLNE